MMLQRVRPLAASPGRVEITLDDIADAVFATDAENRITAWTPSAARLFGYSADEAVGRLFGELLPFSMRDEADERRFFETLRAGRVWRGQGTVRLRDGSQIWLESTIKPRFVDGRFAGSVSVSRDMTDAIKEQRVVAAEERFLDRVLDGAGALVVIFDSAGRVVRFNRACERVSGRSASEVLGRPIWDLVLPPEEVAAIVREFEDLRAGAFPHTHESHWRGRDGSRRLIEWSATCLTNGDGDVTHVVGVGIDVTDERRADEALRGIEGIGQVLAIEGPTPAALKAVIDLLAERMGYRYLTLLLAEDDRLRIGARHGDNASMAHLPLDRGVVGRVFRRGEPEWVRDVSADADYEPGTPDVCGEMCLPLRVEGQTVGILNIETTADLPFTERDFRLAQTAAERLAVALLLGREQQALAERARLFAALTEFAAAANAILDPEQLWPALLDAATAVIPAAAATISVLDRARGAFIVRAIRGMDQSVVGTEIEPGHGSAGWAISAKETVGPRVLSRDDYTLAEAGHIAADSIVTLSAPLIRDGRVLGSITLVRDVAGPEFTDLEREVVGLMAGQAALALSNAELHREVSELAIHDPLTGVYNRRHLDAILELIVDRWRQLRPSDVSLAVVMFDLDEFGRFNKEHGHQAGDAVLRAFAHILRRSVRSTDVIARFGGEEFLVILERCSLARAVALADVIREELEATVIATPGGAQLRARVSAGCTVLDPAHPTSEALIGAADVALAAAKREGRNRVVACAPRTAQ